MATGIRSALSALVSGLGNAPQIFAILVLTSFMIGFTVAILRRAARRPFFTMETAGSVKQLRLVDRINLSSDSFIMKFEFPDQNQILGLPAGKHVTIFGPNRLGAVRGKWNGKPDLSAGENTISRKFTPISGDETVGSVEFVVKAYRPGADVRFPDGGKLSTWLDGLKPGSIIEVSGPVGRTEYLGHGMFNSSGVKIGPFKKIVMIAGGSGLTPLYRIIVKILNDRQDRTECHMLYANRTEEDILCRDRLEEFESHHSDRLKLWYAVDCLTEQQDPTKWKYHIGWLNKEVMEKQLCEGANNTTIALICGPQPMVQLAQQILTDHLGYSEKNVITF